MSVDPGVNLRKTPGSVPSSKLPFCVIFAHAEPGATAISPDMTKVTVNNFTILFII
jgi:hypothetical protein